MYVERGCYGGKILFIDLNKGEGKRQAIGDSFALKYLGGDGFGAYFVNKYIDASIEPFSPDNAIIFSAGLLTGTIFPTGGKAAAFSKSPLTNGWAEGVSGGRIGFALKQAGYDSVIIRGKAKKLSYLVIKNDEVVIKDATHLSGMTTRQTAEEIKKDEGNEFVVASIGIAGEKLVRFASIDCDERQFGRAGIGAVMGSKLLKGIAVYGDKDIKVAKPEKMYKLFEDYYEKIVTHPSFQDDGKYGTGEFLEWMNAERGTFPTKNWSEGVFDNRDKINPYYWAPRYVLKNKACIQCPKPCGKAFVLKGDGMLDGVEYETLFSLGSNCGVGDIEAVAKGNELCDLYGMDTISTGGVIGYTMDLYENGLLSKNEIGIEARFGDGDAMIELIKKIAKREGIGNILAEGVKRASEKFGKDAEKYAVHVRGMEPPAYDVRGIKGMALAFMTSPRGACHLRSAAYALELTGKFWKYEGVDRFSSKNKGKEIADMENFMAVYDALGVCKFSRGIFLLDFYDALDAAIGRGFTENELLLIGERIHNLKHIFNIKAGWKREHSKLPDKFRMPIPKGVAKGSYISKEEEKEMLDDYFNARGWGKDGIPKRNKIEELEIEEFMQK